LPDAEGVNISQSLSSSVVVDLPYRDVMPQCEGRRGRHERVACTSYGTP
jgi:hypothetical protein